jgi:hypothetical protein
MQDDVYLVVTRYKVERMTKNMPELRRGEFPIKLVVKVDNAAFRSPTVEREVHITDPLDGLDLADVELTKPFISEAEAEMIRIRRLEAMRRALIEHGFEVIPPHGNDEGDPDATG